MAKQLYLLIPAFLLCSLCAIAQKPPMKFGDVSMDELKMTTYEKDSSAAAVVLADYGEAHISGATAQMVFEHHKRIKILKKEGLKWADYSISLFHNGSNRERVSGLKAATYNLENGKVVVTKMSKDAVFDEHFNKNWDKEKFTLANVREGSVIEFTYQINSDFFSNFPNWVFQSEIPIIWSEYRAQIPEFFIYEKYMQGYVVLSVIDSKDVAQPGYREKVNRWVATDVPAFKPEPYMTSETDYVSKINFALSHISFPGQPIQEIMGSWEKMNQNFLESEYFGRVVTGSGFLKKTVEELTAGIDDPSKKIAIIYDYIKKSIEYNEDEDNTVDNTNLKKVFELKKGNCAEINLALTSMLRKADLEADPVLLSTREHGFIREQYPMERQFNYVICAVKLDGKTKLLDATERLLPMDELPERCLNGQGLVISEKNGGWINLDALVRSKTTIDAEFQLTTDDQLEGKLTFKRNGYDAHRVRKKYVTKGKEEYLKEVVGSKTWEVKNSEFKSVEEIGNTLEEAHEVTIGDHVNSAGDVIYIDPFVTAKLEENPFKLEKREYPVDFGSPFDKVYMLRLTLPENYKVDEAPAPKILALPGNAARYIYNVSQSGNSIVITSMLSVNKAIFTQVEYPNLREFYNQMVAKQAEQIVLKKAN